jgi:hypothetical protein
MSNVTVYLDTHHAKVYKMGLEKHTPAPLKDEKHDRKHFYHNLSKELHHATEVFVVGAHNVVAEFKHYCSEHDKTTGKKLVGDETLHSHATDHEVWEKGHKFFLARISQKTV